MGAAVAVALGVYGRVHERSGEAITTLGFDRHHPTEGVVGRGRWSRGDRSWLTAVGMYTRGGRVFSVVHRSSGTLAILVSLPVAYHCLWSLGFADTDTRVLVHSLAGCLVYGAFVTKLLGLHLPRTPPWIVTVAGSLLFASVVTAALTSSVWARYRVRHPVAAESAGRRAPAAPQRW